MEMGCQATGHAPAIALPERTPVWWIPLVCSRLDSLGPQRNSRTRTRPCFCQDGGAWNLFGIYLRATKDCFEWHRLACMWGRGS